MKDEVSGEYFFAKPSTGLPFILPPSSFPRVPLAVPYWSTATYREIFRGVLSGNVTDGAELGKLHSLIADTLKVENIFLCGSGSLALELALHACRVRRGDEVVLPAFCCSAVVPPILAVGATPVLADVGDELNLTVETVAAALTHKTRAILVPHLFGNPADMKPIVELARSKNIRVIDDAAQALGATIDGQPAGSFGAAGVVSFGNQKICAGIGGGALVLRDKELLEDDLRLAIPAYLPVLRRCLSTMFWNRWRRWTAPFAKIRSTNADPGKAPSPYPKESMANLNAAVAASLIHALRENIAARRARVRAYQQLLGNDERLALIPHRSGSACLTQVVRVLSKSRTRDRASDAVKALAAAGYEIQGSYVPIHLLASFPQCVWDRLPYSERVWSNLIELPCEPSVDLDDLERIAAILAATVRA